MRRFWRSNGLSAALVAMFLVALAGQSVAGHRYFNQEQRDHGQPEIGFGSYLANPAFLEATMENWQSEFLSIAAMVMLSIVLRQHGSPESKPVDAAHGETGTSG